MPDDFVDLLLGGPFVLRARPDPVPGDLRLAWGIALVILILESSRGKKASLQKLHFLAHSARTPSSRTKVLDVFSGSARPADLVIRVEPWVNRALSFAKGMGLVDLISGKSAHLSKQGLELAKKLAEAPALEQEKRFLSALKSLATEAAIEKIMCMETLI